MIKVLKISMLASAMALVSACGNAEQKPVAPKSEVEKQSYAIGASMGRYLNDNLKKNAELGINLNQDMILGGIKDALGDKVQFTDEEMRTIMTSLEKEVRKQQQALAAKAAEKGKEFLAENAKREGVVVTESGLQYEVMTQGEGEKPAATDRVTVHYHGTLTDGTVFDSSVERNSPATFGLNQVIKGWTEGVQLMPVGSKFKFFIPSDLAYGARATGKIPAHSALVFEVELLSINK